MTSEKRLPYLPAIVAAIILFFGVPYAYSAVLTELKANGDVVSTGNPLPVKTVDAGGGALTGTTSTLLTNASATGSATAWGGGKATFTCWATVWNGATAQLQSTPDSGATWIDATGAVVGVNGGFRGMDLEATSYRVLITGSPTAVSCNLTRSG